MAEEKKGKDLAAVKGQIGQIVEAIAKPLGFVITLVLPLLIQYTTKAVELYQKLPQNAISFLIGFLFCFFGGIFPTLFAAVQAAEHGGRAKVVEAVGDLADQALKIVEESKKDDEKDDDGDGIQDVKQISGSEYIQRKTILILKKINPEKIDLAISSIYSVWLSVAAVLSLKFARTISNALSLANFLNKPCDRFIAPVLRMAVPTPYEKWIPVILRWITKSIAMSIAWYIESVQSAFTSAVSGGLMMAEASYMFLLHRKITLFGLITEDLNDSYVDEVAQYVFAALGFYFQFSTNFSLPTPFNLLLFPFEIAEYWIRWTITSAQ